MTDTLAASRLDAYQLASRLSDDPVRASPVGIIPRGWKNRL